MNLYRVGEYVRVASNVVYPLWRHVQGQLRVEEVVVNTYGATAYWVVTERGGRHFLTEEALAPLPTYTLDEIVGEP